MMKASICFHDSNADIFQVKKIILDYCKNIYFCKFLEADNLLRKYIPRKNHQCLGRFKKIQMCKKVGEKCFDNILKHYFS